MKNRYSFLSLMLSFVALLGFSGTAVALEQSTNGLVYVGWQQIVTTNPLPKNPIAVAAVSNIATAGGSNDFVAIAPSGSDAGLYFLDPSNQSLGWQKKGMLSNAHADAVCCGLNRIFVFGRDRKTGDAVVATSADNGSTWTQNEIVGATASFNNAAFSGTLGVATGNKGAVATTTDGITWTQTVAPSGVSKNVSYEFLPLGLGETVPKLGFVLTNAGVKNHCGFLLVDDFATLVPLYSTDGTLWNQMSMGARLPLSPNQFLIYGSTVYLSNGGSYYSSPFASMSTFTGSDFISIASDTIPQIEITHFIIAGGCFFGVGSNIATQQPLSIVTPMQLVSGVHVISTEVLPMALVGISCCPSGFVGIGSDGSSYYAPTAESQISAPPGNN